jgi:outer membrane protein assembly factor BamB
MRKSLLFFLLFIVFAPLYSQISETWKSTIQGTVHWQHVTPNGNFLVGTSTGLVCINQNSGDILWSSAAHANIQVEQVQQNGPLLTIIRPDLVEMINPFNGNLAFHSGKAGIQEVVDSYYLPRSNGMLVSGMDRGGKPLMVYSDLTTGEVKWKIDDDFGRLIHASDLSESQALIVTLWSNYRINVTDGNIIWKSSSTKTELKGALGNLLKTVATQQANQMDINVAFYRHPGKDIFYIASEKEATSGFTTSTAQGTPQINYETQYNAFDLSNGEFIWDEPLTVQGMIGQVIFHENGLLVLPDNGSNTSINLFDYQSQEGLWGKKGKGLKVKGGIYDFLPAGNGLVLISAQNDKNFMSYLDTDQGLLTFEKPVKVDGEILYTEETSKGILYVTTEELNILDPVNGTLLFPKSIATNADLIAHHGNDLYVYDLKEQHLKRINKQTADIRIASPEIVFEGKEVPGGIEQMENGIFVHSDQNVALVNFSGDKIYQKYYEAPKEPGLKKALLYAEAVRAAYISANAYAASAQLQSAAPKVREQDAATGAIVEGFGQMYGQLGDAANDFAKQSFAQAQARFKATTQSRDFMVVLTQLEKKNNALVVVNKATGEMQSFISLGTEKTPDYAMDDVTGKVFYRTSTNTISGFDLN